MTELVERLIIVDERRIYVANFPNQILSNLSTLQDFWTIQDHWHGLPLKDVVNQIDKVVARITLLDEDVVDNYDTLIYFSTWLSTLKEEIQLNEYDDNSLCLCYLLCGRLDSKDNVKLREHAKGYMLYSVVKRIREMTNNDNDLLGNSETGLLCRTLKSFCFDYDAETKHSDSSENLSLKQVLERCGIVLMTTNKLLPEFDDEKLLNRVLDDMLRTNELYILDECDAYAVYGILLYMFPDFQQHSVFRTLKMYCFDSALLER